MLLVPFLSSIINLQIKLQPARSPKLTEKNVPERSFLGLMGKTGDDTFPIADEGAEVVTDELDFKWVFYALERACFFVRFNVMLKHQLDLSSATVLPPEASDSL